MSRLVETLHKLRKSAAPLGFGFNTTAAPAKRMLVIARVAGALDGDAPARVSACADAVVFVSSPRGEPARPDVAWPAGGIPAGVWCESVLPAPSPEAGGAWDFAVCGSDCPAEVLTWKDCSCLVRVSPGTESGRLRAIADLGVDALVLSSEGLDLSRISGAVECRRVRSMSGKPVLLLVSAAVTPRQAAVLWRAGVDALVVDATGGLELLETIREAVRSAPYDARGDGRGTASVGAFMAPAEAAPVEEKEDEGEEEEEPDEDSHDH